MSAYLAPSGQSVVVYKAGYQDPIENTYTSYTVSGSTRDEAMRKAMRRTPDLRVLATVSRADDDALVWQHGQWLSAAAEPRGYTLPQGARLFKDFPLGGQFSWTEHDDGFAPRLEKLDELHCQRLDNHLVFEVDPFQAFWPR